MRFIRYVTILGLIGALAGCFGHGYEGEYQSQAGSSNEFMDAFAGAIEPQKVIIGSNFVESQGERETFDEIFVRDSGEDKYLVFKNANSEKAWKILNKDTLMHGNELVNIKLVRIK